MNGSVTISLGSGRRNPEARRAGVQPPEFASTLERHTGDDAWWSPCLWRGDRRSKDAFEGAHLLAIDVDHFSADGVHDAMPDDVWAAAQRALEGARHGWRHRTPRGMRMIAALDRPVTAGEDYGRVARVWGAEIQCVIDAADIGERLQVDVPASSDRARLLFGPRATVEGRLRDATVTAVPGAAPLSVQALLARAPAPPLRPPVVASNWRGNPNVYYLRLRAWLSARPRSIQKQRGSDELMRALGKICAAARLSPEQEWDLAMYYGTECSDPPWSEREIRHAIENARRDRRGTPLLDRDRPQKPHPGATWRHP